MVTTSKATKCSHCQGQLRADEDELVCMNCGRRHVPAANGAGKETPSTGVEIVITLTPKTFPELADALASANGYSSGKNYLVAKGATVGMAGEMMKGNILDIRALKAICTETAITKGDFFKLLDATMPLAKVEASTSRSGGTFKPCPACQEMIGIRSKKCRHCGAAV